MSTEAGGSFEDLNRQRITPELTRYLNTNSEVDPATLLVLPHIPQLIGGIKSRRFIKKDPEASPDAPPNPESDIDLRKPADLKAFAEVFTSSENRADGQYNNALFETQHVIAEAEERGVTVDRLFIPDTVNDSAEEYLRRLGRLAQDTGLSVVIQYKAASFKEFDPPVAESVEAYWAARAQQIRPFARATVPPEPEDEEAIAALLTLTPEPEHHDWRARNGLLRKLRTVANATPDKLQEWLLQPGQPTSAMLPLVKELGFGASRVDDTHRASARMVLAKINDQDGLAALANQLREKNDDYGAPSTFMEPLGVYLRNDPELLTGVMRRVDRLVEESPDDGELHPLLGALYHTNDLRVGGFLSKYLAVPPAAGKHYARNVLTPTLRWLPGYIDTVHQMPESPQQQTTLAVIEERVATFLEDITTGHHDHVKNARWIHGTSRVADMLLKFKNPAHHDLLRRHMLALFQETGSVLEPTGSIHDETFVRQYLQYRELYRDIPEISRLIKISRD